MAASLPGNSLFREICRNVSQRYQKADTRWVQFSRATKQRVVRQVLHLVQGQDPPGRFLVREGGAYKNATEEEVIEQIHQALRNQKPPKKKYPLRKRLRKHLVYKVDPNPISIPRETDVLFGRGNGVATWPGNAKFRELCWDVHDGSVVFIGTTLLTLFVYYLAIRMEKQLVAQRVVQMVQGLDPPGRFFFRVGSVYRQAEEDEVVDKICKS